jgi:hypothetical protein
MKIMRITEADLSELGTVVCQVTGLPPGQVAGFAIMVAVYEEDGSAGGRLIASTPSLRAVAKLIEVAGTQVGEELDRLAGLT